MVSKGGQLLWSGTGCRNMHQATADSLVSRRAPLGIDALECQGHISYGDEVTESRTILEEGSLGCIRVSSQVSGLSGLNVVASFVRTADDV